MTKARLHIHDASRANHQATIEALEIARDIAASHDIDGAIVILSDRNGGTPCLKLAGRLAKNDKAILKLLQLQLTLATED